MRIDVKPDRIFINWANDGNGNPVVTAAVLGDFDVAYKPKARESQNAPDAIGNVNWRSPEGQTGRGVMKASDVYSFGLVVS